jgi:N-acetylmuramoyl-L-alanine amidase
MKITDHRLENVAFEASPNQSGEMTPEYVVIHYTATQGKAGVVQAFKTPAAKVSAHLVIGIDGVITQMVPFNRIAWHAGASAWAGKSGCNAFTIGIEIVNPGPLLGTSNGYTDVYGRRFSGDAIEAYHKSGLVRQWKYWAAYPTAQLEAVEDACSCLFDTYSLKDVVGHDDIAPGRKFDPGPAFPLTSLRGRLQGRSSDQPPYFTATTVLNVRQGPGVQYATVEGSPLSPGKPVLVVEGSDTWWMVHTPDGSVEGWVNSHYLHPMS